jgi:hypothetical protein
MLVAELEVLIQTHPQQFMVDLVVEEIAVEVQ